MYSILVAANIINILYNDWTERKQTDRTLREFRISCTENVRYHGIFIRLLSGSNPTELDSVGLPNTELDSVGLLNLNHKANA